MAYAQAIQTEQAYKDRLPAPYTRLEMKYGSYAGISRQPDLPPNSISRGLDALRLPRKSPVMLISWTSQIPWSAPNIPCLTSRICHLQSLCRTKATCPTSYHYWWQYWIRGWRNPGLQVYSQNLGISCSLGWLWWTDLGACGTGEKLAWVGSSFPPEISKETTTGLPAITVNYAWFMGSLFLFRGLTS